MARRSMCWFRFFATLWMLSREVASIAPSRSTTSSRTSGVSIPTISAAFAVSMQERTNAMVCGCSDFTRLKTC